MPAFGAHVVTTETVLLRYAVASLDRRLICMGTRWRNGAEYCFCVSKVELNNAPGNLRLVRVCEDLERWREFEMRDHVGAHGETVAFRVFRPAGRGLSVDFQH